MKRAAIVALTACALPAFAQFDLVLPDGTAVPPVFDLGQAYVGEPLTAHFRLRNHTATATTLTSLSLAGAGFSLRAPAVPVSIPAQGAIDLTAGFLADETGTYSAALRADGIGVLLTATVTPSLTYRLDNGGVLVLLTAIDFGGVVRGSSAQRRIALRNETNSILTVPPISVQGDGFSLAGSLPSGQSLAPQQEAECIVVFTPRTIGTAQGALAIGNRSFPLLGTGVDPPLPKPSITIQLPSVASAQQGTLMIRFDAPAKVAGVGTVALEFSGAADPGIAWAAGGRNATFAVAPGDTQAALGFQTGTSKGTLTFTVKLGASTVQQNLTVGAAPAVVTALETLRRGGALEIRVTGFDNTRTAGLLVFTFLDGAGKALASIQSDSSADFAKYFATSEMGGLFLLRAVFPVSGDASQVTRCDVALTNAAGTTMQRVVLP